MWKRILHLVKATFPLVICSAFISSSFGQQHVIADKDKTRTDINNSITSDAKITLFSAVNLNGFNEIKWGAINEKDTRRFIVEYSVSGNDFQTAGEMIPVNGVYKLEHHTFETRPLLYRIRIENTDGKFFNTANFLLEGINVSPVQVYPTAVKGNMVNVNTSFAVESTRILSSDGQQVFTKNIGGLNGYIPIAIPTLKKGMYLMTFYGSGWQSTEKILVVD